MYWIRWNSYFHIFVYSIAPTILSKYSFVTEYKFGNSFRIQFSFSQKVNMRPQLTYGYYQALCVQSPQSVAWVAKQTLVPPNGRSYTRYAMGGNAGIVMTKSGPFIVENNSEGQSNLGKCPDSSNENWTEWLFCEILISYLVRSSGIRRINSHWKRRSHNSYLKHEINNDFCVNKDGFVTHLPTFIIK